MTTDPRATIAELRRLLCEATPGPWRAEADPNWVLDEPDEIGPWNLRGPFVVDRFDYNALNEHNAKLIAAAINALSVLLDLAEAGLADTARLTWLESQAHKDADDKLAYAMPVTDPATKLWYIYTDDEARDIEAVSTLREAIDAAAAKEAEGSDE